MPARHTEWHANGDIARTQAALRTRNVPVYGMESQYFFFTIGTNLDYVLQGQKMFVCLILETVVIRFTIYRVYVGPHWDLRPMASILL